MEINEVLENGDQWFIPNLSIDLVIIGFSKNTLKCLLLKHSGKWMLPGGFIKKKESVEDAVQSVLKNRTGLGNAHFKFLSVFGKKNRKFKTTWKAFFKKRKIEWTEDNWLNDRFVSLAYYSLVDIENTHPFVGEVDEKVEWFDMEDLPMMWMDHASIVNTARQRLKEDIRHEHLTYNLLPKEFTMPELHQLHQVILDEKIDRSRFQKKIIASDIFERLPKLKKSTPGRNPYQYRLKDQG